ncbi:MAG: hypothetical protein KDA89_11620 [Planctomycetaceae bacterium]|nr:hypothetical protein [Planctomycetaceae bacterium]
MEHTIRLAGPWELVRLPDNSVSRIQLPWAAVSSATGPRTAMLRRRFNQPTGLTENTSLKILVSASVPLSEIRVNDECVPSSGISDTQRSPKTEMFSVIVNSFDITHCIRPYNVLEISTDLPGIPDGSGVSVESVVLQICEPASGN